MNSEIVSEKHVANTGDLTTVEYLMLPGQLPTVYHRYHRYHRHHRLDGPAYDAHKTANPDIKRFQSWWVAGIRHREDGPAIIRYTDGGEVEAKEYWVGGHKLSEEKFKERFMSDKPLLDYEF